MALISGSLSITSNLSAGQACAEVQCTSIHRITVFELIVTLDTAPGAVSTVGMGQPAAIGIGPTRIAVLPEDTGSLGNTYPELVGAWVTPPTAPVNFLRRGNMDNSIGQMIHWPFPRGLVIPQNSSLVFWNITDIGHITLTAVVDV